MLQSPGEVASETMDAGAPAHASSPAGTANSFALKAPIPSLPKGGGAIRGIGEKFTAQSATGTGSLSVPLPISPGRGGAQPALQLQYDSGAGNGPFGLGWQLNLPSISRKTDKGLPRYLDNSESDVFLIAGAEDLVPLLDAVSGERLPPQNVRVGGRRFAVSQYRPRIEGLFARIERWSGADDAGDCFWRVLDRSNNSQWYGRGAGSRVADPADPTRIFQWWLSSSHDDKGNVVVYEYAPDDTRGAQKHLKRVCYGNRAPYLPTLHPEQSEPPLPEDWMFELVFDFGDHDADDPRAAPDRVAPARTDAFSDYRAGFERRTSRRVERVLMFHHFAEVPALGANALVRSLRIRYAAAGALEDPQQPGYSQIEAIEPWAHERHADGRLLSRQAPPVEFRYSQPRIDTTVRGISAADLPGLPVGTQGPGVQWVDLDGEGLSGVLSDDGESWRYAQNLGEGRFAPSRVVATTPAKRALSRGQRLMDLDGDGAIDVVEFEGTAPGYHERDPARGWTAFVPFARLPRIAWDDPNLRFVDLTGDGHADALITEDEVFTWYPSLAEQGFDAAETVRPPGSERGTRLVFADGTQTMFLADMCGDGLTDIVRIRNGEVCYWPNLGYGQFGAKVSMGRAPRFDHDDQFDPKRLRLVDIDGSGPTDIVYLGRGGAQIYFNRCGNSWSDARLVEFPVATLNLDSVQVTDLLGRGTACLVWNSHLPADAGEPVRYIDLMSGTKPHLLVETRNNLGGSTHIEYAPSTHFYLADKAAGTPWITKLPFPVQCVSRVTARDAWRGTAFSTTYSYHHGHFDGVEREFRGFGRVEQADVEEYGRFADANSRSPWITDDQTLYQPPVKTITWFHTGLAEDRARVLSHFASEYFPARYRMVGDFQERELPEPVLDAGLHIDEWREALRACKGMVLRQEVYELDINELAGPLSRHVPMRLFSAATHNCHIDRVQARGANRHAVFLVTESEALTYQYEQALGDPGSDVLADPRVSHTLTLRVDDLGQPVQQVKVAYPRVRPHEHASLDGITLSRIHAVQAERHVAYAETRFTADVLLPAVDATDAALRHRRLRLPCETLSFELAGLTSAHRAYFEPGDFAALRLSDTYAPMDPDATPVEVASLPYHRSPQGLVPERRLVEHLRTQYFDDSSDETSPSAPLPPGRHGPRGLRYEVYKLALTDELIAAVFPSDMMGRELKPGVTPRSLLNDESISGYRRDSERSEYWVRSGIAGFAADAARHFYLPERFTDAFGAVTTLEYDPLDLYVRRVEDMRWNTNEVLRFDYRAMAPVEMVDPNGNHTHTVLDIFGLPVATAAKGKALDGGWEGDDVDAFVADSALRNLDPMAVQAFCADSTVDEAQASVWLARASSRFVYHFGERRDREGNVVAWATRPASVCAIAREIHATQAGGEHSPLQVALQCSDGGGNVLMAKQQAEPDMDSDAPRWIVNGLTVLNNKGKPVKQYEPFFSRQFGCEMPRPEGVTPILYYDAAGRVIRTDAPDGTFSRVEFSPWHSWQFDAGDTALESAWYAARSSPTASDEDRRAALQSAKYANTPALTLLDSLGRTVVTVAHNRTPSYAEEFSRTPLLERPWLDHFAVTQAKLDVEGKTLWLRDARGNLVMQYLQPARPNDDPTDDRSPDSAPCYDIAGNLLFRHSMDAGGRWSLNDAAGKPMCAWDANDRLDTDGNASLEHRLSHTEYDSLHRPVRQWLRLGDAPALVVERFEYRDSDELIADEARANNLIGQAVQHDDPGGRVELLRVGFTGKAEIQVRRFLSHSGARVPDWSGDEVARDALLEPVTFTRRSRHDALGRMTQLANWHRGAARVAVYTPRYNQRGLLEAEDLRIGATLDEHGSASGGRVSQAVHGIAYDAKGQRIQLCHGNGTETRYDYDPLTFRLKQLRTTRPGSALWFPEYRSQLNDEHVLQQLHYTYDAAGNVCELFDEAWAPAFFRNQAVEPRSLHVYDALHRLIEASGRESAALSAAPTGFGDPVPVDGFPSDHALRNYTQRYAYDSVGNFESMQHFADGGNWTRHYETAVDSNRLMRTWLGNDEIGAERYDYDTHGSMLNLTSVPVAARIRWDWRDMIEGMDLGGGGRASYSYDIGKQRTRKRIERLGGAVEERVYLGGTELYRRYSAAGDLVEEIETHHLFVDDQRVLLVDDIIATDNPTLGTGQQLMRFQHGNHLGSVALELDEEARIIGHEEFHPYGTTAHHLVSRAVRATAKRYRYSGMEKDAESSLSYHGARYCAAHLARWTSVDPAGLRGGQNAYLYGAANPVTYRDPSGTQPRASFGDIAEYRRQLRAVRGTGGIRLSEHEHIGAFINHYLSLLDPVTGLSAMDRAAYRRMVTLTIPRDMALLKTAEDMALRDRLRAARSSGVVSPSLAAELLPEAAIQRMIRARDAAIAARVSAGLPVDSLLAITDDHIARATHYQWGQLFDSGDDAARAFVREASEMPSDEAFDEAFRETADGSDAVEPSGRRATSEGLSAVDADVDATGRVVEGPRTGAALERRARRTTGSAPVEAPVAPTAAVPDAPSAPGLGSADDVAETVIAGTPDLTPPGGPMRTAARVLDGVGMAADVADIATQPTPEDSWAALGEGVVAMGIVRVIGIVPILVVLAFGMVFSHD
ncbi:MAG TPA: SpvB/TcaC N-terminal domain-containing protein [Steroidobacteraceae bacterium]|nr:SpvB/TcaC N-terminal domain-containing protein [Steroidobacteraceae bacterium]